MHIYKVHFTGREKNAIGIFYTMSDAFQASGDTDFIEQFWEKYELGTVTRTNLFFFEVTKDNKTYQLDTFKMAGVSFCYNCENPRNRCRCDEDGD
jgi:hypothetical protein